MSQVDLEPQSIALINFYIFYLQIFPQVRKMLGINLTWNNDIKGAWFLTSFFLWQLHYLPSMTTTSSREIGLVLILITVIYKQKGKVESPQDIFLSLLKRCSSYWGFWSIPPSGLGWHYQRWQHVLVWAFHEGSDTCPAASDCSPHFSAWNETPWRLESNANIIL